MKTTLLTIAIAAFCSLSVPAQDGTTTGPTAKVDPGKPAPKPFVRERFDTKRDPKIDLQKAVEQAVKNGKRIILDVGGEWCGWCVYMDKFIADNAELARLRDDGFVWVKVNYSEENENRAFLSPYPEPNGFPHLYVLDQTGKLLYSEDTSGLEKGEEYDLAKFIKFLQTWSPNKNPTTH